jgi:hypothetical protein
MSIDGLPGGQRSKVYRRLVELLKADPTLSSVVKTWMTWEDEQLQEPVLQTAPAILLSPSIGPMPMASADSFVSDFVVNVGLVIEGRCATDALDLWEAIENALYPPDRGLQQAIQRELSSCEFRAVTGLVQFGRPPLLAAFENNLARYDGSISIAIRRLLNA